MLFQTSPVGDGAIGATITSSRYHHRHITITIPSTSTSASSAPTSPPSPPSPPHPDSNSQLRLKKNFSCPLVKQTHAQVALPAQPVELRSLDRERMRVAFSLKPTPYHLPDEERGMIPGGVAVARIRSKTLTMSSLTLTFTSLTMTPSSVTLSFIRLPLVKDECGA